jgi:hypothetical protein
MVDMDYIYQKWLTANEDDLRDQWSVMGSVERFEEGGDFPTYCLNQYEAQKDFSNTATL